MNNGMATFANPHVRCAVRAGRRAVGALGKSRHDTAISTWTGEPGALGTTCPVAGCVRGGEQKIVALGLNWYLSDNVRVLFDYMFIHVDKLSGLGVQIGQDVTVVGTRFQFTN